MNRQRRVNNNKNKKKNNKKIQQNSNNNTNTTKEGHNEFNTKTSVKVYSPTLLNILSKLDIIYTNTLLSLGDTFNETFKTTLVEVFKRKSQNAEHLLHATEFTHQYNYVNQYWDGNGRTSSYFNNFNRLYYNDKQFDNKEAVFPFSFEELVQLYRTFNVYSEVVLMVSELLPSKIEFSRSVLFGRVIKTQNLGSLKSEIKIPLELGLEDYLNRYSFFLVILASNGVLAYSRPFSLHLRNFESNDNLLKLTL